MTFPRQKADTRSAFQPFRSFPDEEAVRMYLAVPCRGGEAFFGHCGSARVLECRDQEPIRCRKDRRKHFSVRTGTVGFRSFSR